MRCFSMLLHQNGMTLKFLGGADYILLPTSKCFSADVGECTVLVNRPQVFKNPWKPLRLSVSMFD